MVKIFGLSIIGGIVGMMPSVIGIIQGKRQLEEYYVYTRKKSAIITFCISLVFAILCLCKMDEQSFRGLLISLWPVLLLDNFILVVSTDSQYYDSELVVSIASIVISLVSCVVFVIQS